MESSKIGLWIKAIRGNLIPLILTPLILFSLFTVLHAGEVKETILPNGLKVLTLSDNRIPIVTFQVWYKVGSRNEPSGKTGMSHLLEHMMFKGTDKIKPTEFSKIIQRNGGRDNAFTTKDYTAYYQILASDRLHISLDLEADRMVNLRLEPKEVASEKDVVAEERRMRYEDDPQNTAYEELLSVAYKTHPYRNPVIGWMSDIKSITREDLYNYYKTYYAPNNATIVVAGDFDTQSLLRNIEKHFGSLRPANIPPQEAPAEPQQKGERRIKIKKEAELPYLIAGYHVPTLKDKDGYALEVLSTILSSGKSSRIYRNLVYEKQIALYAGGDYSGLSKDSTLFYLYAAATIGKDIQMVEDSLYNEIERFKKEYVSDKELEKAKNQIEASFLMSQDSIFFQAELLGMAESLGDWRYIEKYLPGIRAVTKEDIQMVAKKYLNEDNRTVAILVPVRRTEN
ncbi:MAG: pitrilysin family protein [Nitrospirota bacterium]